MIYSQPEFIFLFLGTVALFYSFPTKTARFAILLVASLFFYSWSGVRDTLIFFFVILGSWLSVWAAFHWPKKKQLWLTIGVSLMAGHLFFWKYAGWLVSEIQKVYPNFYWAKPLELPLPIGISFFTLQGIAYLVDASRNQAPLVKFRDYLLFKSFFPQLVAGPIVRLKQLMPQLEKLETPSKQRLLEGVTLFTMGFFKKMLLSDRSAFLIDEVFRSPSSHNRNLLLLAILGYTVQIWADFSGYTDMGRGAAKILGIELPENFLSPYFSRSPSEFWKRWHITLSQWIRDYLYIPLGGNRGSAWQTAGVALLTMGLAGLWHGANWTFVLWGLYHGALLVLSRYTSKISLWRKIPALLRSGVSLVLMQLAVMFGWLIFRAPNLPALGDFLRSVALNTGAAYPYSLKAFTLAIGIAYLMQGVSYFNLSTKRYPVKDWLAQRLAAPLANVFSSATRASLAGVLCGLALSFLAFASLFFRTAAESPPFIYFQF